MKNICRIKLFNTNEYNISVENQLYGTSDFLNGFPTKKPFLSHQSAVFDIAGRITGEMAGNLHDFQEIMRRNVLPRPLPLFVYREELQTEMLAVFSRYLADGKRIGYQEIIRELYKNHQDDTVIIIYCITMAIRFVISILFLVSAIVCRVGIKKVGW